MSQDVENIKKVLRIYSSRGEQALQALVGSDYVALGELLKQREAAFHNFKYLDAIATEKDPNYSNHDEFREIWSKLQDINQSLEKHLKAHRDCLKQALLKSQLQRAKIQKFQSFHANRSDIVLGV